MFYWYEQVAVGLICFSLMQFIQFYVLEGEDILLYVIGKMKGKK
jgi:hypothetical protein